MVDLFDLLKDTGLPVAYHHFDKPPALPYIVYYSTGANNFGADDKVYHSEPEIMIELYTKKKDLISETLIEETLDSVDMYWDKEETYIDSEKMFQIVYSI